MAVAPVRPLLALRNPALARPPVEGLRAGRDSRGTRHAELGVAVAISHGRTGRGGSSPRGWGGNLTGMTRDPCASGDGRSRRSRRCAPRPPWCTSSPSGPLAGLRLALVHGRMKAEEKDAVMRRFK